MSAGTGSILLNKLVGIGLEENNNNYRHHGKDDRDILWAVSLDASSAKPSRDHRSLVSTYYDLFFPHFPHLLLL